jgi:hypothetical protein
MKIIVLTWKIKRVFIGTSLDIQSNLLASISIVVLNKIKEEVKQTFFMSVIEDELVDVFGNFNFYLFLSDS